MATVSQRNIVDTIIENDGVYPGDDPANPVVKIVEYRNQFNGDVAWGLVYASDDYFRYEKAPACHFPRVIYERGQ